MLQVRLSNKIKLGRNATLTQEVDGTYQSKITLITGSIPSIEDDGYLGVQSGIWWTGTTMNRSGSDVGDVFVGCEAAERLEPAGKREMALPGRAGS
ncbi:hypothetical protein [uncultured Sphingomonas sp.]|uniref:hypothetical protein n=1 Tax=uncultured Sphingomonas sp. TaxID=158754 RepID=UPI0025F328C7|nr:hypothetical protein [uncultured Sphingomonas sp.]